MFGFPNAGGAALLASFAVTLAAATPAQAAPVYTQVGADLTQSDYSFSFRDGSFTFGPGDGSFFSFLSVSTGGTGAVRTVFGQPSQDFNNRGYPFYDANTLGGFGPFPAMTFLSPSAPGVFLGLRVGAGPDFYYGFASFDGSTLVSYAFENQPNTGILGTTAVPEPASWALLTIGFGAVGVALRRRHRLSARASFG